MEPTNDPDEWEHHSDDAGGIWQSKRNSACFSTDGGKTYYHLDDRDRIHISEPAKTDA